METIAIIGGGLGGLTTGALLSKNGYKVILLEQHNIVGGCATFFKRKDFICEVGLHDMNGAFSGTIKEIFDELDVYKNIEFVKPNEFFKVYTKKTTFVMPHSRKEAIKALKREFTSESEAIDKYFQILEDIAKAYKRLEEKKWYQMALFPLFFYSLLKYKNKNVAQVLDSLTSNEELKLILNANIQYYNDSANTLCFLLHGVAQNSYLDEGGYFIKGGSYKLSEYLAQIIKKNGGEIITKAKVIKSRPNEITYLHKKETVRIEVDKIVSNISPNDTYELFDVDYHDKMDVSESLVSIYLGFSKNLKSFYGKNAYSNFIFDDLVGISDYEKMIQGNILNRGFVFVDYSQIDSQLTTEEKSFGAICISDDISSWETLDKKEYMDKKEKLLARVISKLETHYPGISNLIEYSEVATPKTMKKYLLTPNGTAYGYKPNTKQFFRIPQTKSKKVDNLYFAGQFVISGGFSPSIMSGKMCFESIVKGS